MENPQNPIATQTRHLARASAAAFQAEHHRWHFLYHPDGRRLADDAQRLASLENLLSLLPAVGEAGPLGTHSPRHPRHGPPRSWKKKAPTAAIIDSQSVRTASQSGVRGYDAGKKITGRKRHVLVDTQGNILALKVTTADVQDRDGAKLLLNVQTVAFGWLMLIWADGGYAGKLIEHVAEIPRHRRVKLEIVKRSDDVKGFKVVPKRWIVERTFGWLIQSRRLIRDYEVKIEHSEAMIYLSMSKRMLARITR